MSKATKQNQNGKESTDNTRQCPKCNKDMEITRQFCDCGFNIGYYYKFGKEHTPRKATLWFT
jgi:hypothetical protein